MAGGSRISRNRGQIPATRGIGEHFSSPRKPRDKRKTREFVQVPGQALTRRRLLAKFEALKAASSPMEPEPTEWEPSMDQEPTTGEPTTGMEPVDPFPLGPPGFIDIFPPNDIEMITAPTPDPSRAAKRRRSAHPDSEPVRLYTKWKSLIPSLVNSLILYRNSSLGCIITSPTDITATCQSTDCPAKSTTILCLYLDHYRNILVSVCACFPIPQVLVKRGLFPASPSQPRTAISIDLLEFYRDLFERSCDAVNAFAGALSSFYTKRGYQMLNKKGELVHDAFRRSLASASQWYDSLRSLVELQLEAAIEAGSRRVPPCTSNPLSSALCTSNPLSNVPSSPNPLPYTSAPMLGHPRAPLLSEAPCALHPPPTTNAPSVGSTNNRSRCSRLLRQRCPACFGGVEFGRSFDQGGDFHAGVDGNFHHRHRKMAGDSPHFFDAAYVLPKQQVDDIGDHIDAQRKKPAKNYVRKLPDEAVDECGRAHEAADGRKQKTSMEHFDDTGIMAIVCRHDIPLFFANIDTPGEQQKYAVTLIVELFSHLPSNATVVLQYDVGCVMDRSRSLYDLFPPSIGARLKFTMTAMHAYAHQWSCQIVFNPRLQVGLGLSDGEGVERLWSRLRKLIGVTRCSGRSRRIWLIDRQASAIGLDLRDNLGDWIRHRLTRGVQNKSDQAREILSDCGVSLDDLRSQWELQKASQLSVRAHAPACMKKELDTVLNLQGNLDEVDKAIGTARAAIANMEQPSQSLEALKSLERTHERLNTKVEALFASMNIQESFSEFNGMDLEFVQTLLMARDLKINIRKCAIGSFFEWDKLDQAVGGHESALGTKLHQNTRETITKRKPALLSAIKKFNKYCTRLAVLHRPEWSVPLPEPLPLQLAALRDSRVLMEDIWIIPSVGEVPRWLRDLDVRNGIRAMHLLDRCNEEYRRLELEAENLCRWTGEELAAVECALQTPTNGHLRLHLECRRDQILHLRTRWSNPFTSSLAFDVQAKQVSGIKPSRASANLVLVPAGSEDNLLSNASTDEDEQLNADQVVIVDFLEDSHEEECGADSESKDVTEVAAQIIWTLPHEVRKDTFAGCRNFQLDTEPLHPFTQNIRLAARNFAGYFSPKDLEILKSPTGLNDTCLNGCANILQEASFSDVSRHCAVLSTHELVRIRCSVDDSSLWRNLKKTSYWLKNIWILPIHRTGPTAHWVLAVLYLDTHEIYLFDSFADKQGWNKDVKDIMQLVLRMVLLANRQGKKLNLRTVGWTARPIAVFPLQTTKYDCGVWVLSSIAAVLRGFHITGLCQEDMARFRNFLHRLVVAQLPPVDDIGSVGFQLV